MSREPQEQGRIFRRSVQKELDHNRPASRPTHTWPSRVTSVDLKLAYDSTRDRFISFIYSDCNANPEGISSVHDSYTECDLIKRTARSYIGRTSRSELIIWLPSSVWDDAKGKWCNEGSWLTEDKKAIVNSILEESDINTVYCCSSVDSVSVRNGSLYYTGPDTANGIAVDGYINLNDTGERLLEALNGQVSLISQGVNSPSGAWTPSLPSTSKVGIARSISDLLQRFERVQMPKFRRVESVQDLNKFRDEIGESVILKDPFGTWGTGVVGIGLNDRAIKTIRAKEEQVRSIRGWGEFQLIDDSTESFAFNSRDCLVPYGIAERALSGSISQNGDKFIIVSVPAKTHPMSTRAPIDFVALACAEPDRTFSVPSVMMRASGKARINGNTRFKYINDTPVENAMQEPLEIPHPRENTKQFEFDLREHLENIAGRHVSTSEINSALRSGAELGLAARNLSAFRAEQNLESNQGKL